MAYAGRAIEDASFGTVAWTNLANAVGAPDGPAANTPQIFTNEDSRYIVLDTYGFSVPAGDVIDGIQVNLSRRRGSSGTCTDARARIVHPVSGIGAEDKADASLWANFNEIISYGGPADLWGEAWTADNINAAGFGFALSVAITIAGEAFVDGGEVLVFSTVGVTGGVLRPRQLTGAENYQFNSGT